MNKLKQLAFVLMVGSGFVSCEKEAKSNWQVEIKNPIRKVALTDISKDFFDPNVSLEKFQQDYPWFQGTVSNDDFQKRRVDTKELEIYKKALAKIDLIKLNSGLSDLFSHIRYYFPKFVTPKVFLYSSGLQTLDDPIFYQPQANMVFIDISGFMGDGSPFYSGYENYLQKSMNPENIVPKVSMIFAQTIVPANKDQQKFIDQMVYQGKLMTLQDAFLPNTPEYLKMNYTEKQYQWSVSNEANVWNYFVENNIIFGEDHRLEERFILQGPFSKFYTEIDNKSSPQVGIFIGWQICKKYLQEKPETKLNDFLVMDATAIFNDSEFKPKN
jgi:hypothetical protein